MHNFYLKTLGLPEIEVDGALLQGFESDKALALLIYLILQRRPLSRSFLTNFFWSDLPEERGQGNLRRVLHNLNQLCPTFLEIDRRTVNFSRQNSSQVDLWQFETLAPHPHHPQAWETALALYRGPFLDSLEISSGSDFDRWLESQREICLTQALHTLEKLSRYYIDQGNYPRALGLTDRALNLAPWHETFHRQKMYLLAHEGQRTNAIRQYQSCRRILLEELDTRPAPETEQLYQRLRRTERRYQVSPPLDPIFIGRQAELGQLAHKLALPNCRLLTLTGPSGIGKSRLALQIAQHCDYLFLDGIAFISLAEIQTAQGLQQALQTAFDHPAGGLTAYLQDKELLLILDNFENLLTDAERHRSLLQLTNLLQTAPHLKILITSCDRLNLSTEWIIALTGLPVQSPEKEGTALQLFLERAQQAGSLQPETPENLHLIQQICELLEGHPLAIELAAALVPYLSLAELFQQLQHNLDLLNTAWPDLPLRHRSLRAVFERSWERLSPAEQSCFAALSVFTGGFTRESAAAITGAAFPMLQQLAAKSLIRITAENRYQLHGTLRGFAGEKLQQSGHVALIFNRHLDYFAALIDRLEKENGSAIQAPQIQTLAADYANLIAALNWARQSGAFETGLHLALGMIGIWDTIQAPGEGCEWLAALADQARTAPAELRARAYNRAGGLAWRQGNLAQAKQYQELALPIQRRQGNRKDIAVTLATLALIDTHSGELHLALERGREGLHIFQELDDRPNIALTLNNLGMSSVESGALEQAQSYLQESLALYLELGLKRGRLMVLNNLGNVARYQSDFARATAHFEEALELARELNDLPTQSIIYSNLGYIDARREEPRRAWQRYQQALEQFSKLERLHDLTETLERIAHLETESGEKSRAVTLFAAAATLRADLHLALSPIDRTEYDHALALLKAGFPPAAFFSLWEQGKKLSWRQAVELAFKKD